MRKEQVINTIWYRLLKVIFIGAILLTTIVALYGTYNDSFFRHERNHEWLETQKIVCLRGWAPSKNGDSCVEQGYTFVSPYINNGIKEGETGHWWYDAYIAPIQAAPNNYPNIFLSGVLKKTGGAYDPNVTVYEFQINQEDQWKVQGYLASGNKLYRLETFYLNHDLDKFIDESILDKNIYISTSKIFNISEGYWVDDFTHLGDETTLKKSRDAAGIEINLPAKTWGEQHYQTMAFLEGSGYFLLYEGILLAAAYFVSRLFFYVVTGEKILTKPILRK